MATGIIAPTILLIAPTRLAGIPPSYYDYDYDYGESLYEYDWDY